MGAAVAHGGRMQTAFKKAGTFMAVRHKPAIFFWLATRALRAVDTDPRLLADNHGRERQGACVPRPRRWFGGRCCLERQRISAGESQDAKPTDAGESEAGESGEEYETDEEEPEEEEEVCGRPEIHCHVLSRWI